MFIIPTKTLSECTAIVDTAINEVNAAPIVMGPFGVYKEVIINANGMICKLNVSDKPHLQLIFVEEELNIAKEHLYAEYSFERDTWRIKSIIPEQDSKQILLTDEMHQLLLQCQCNLSAVKDLEEWMQIFWN